MRTFTPSFRRLLWAIVWLFGSLLAIYVLLVIRFAIGKPVAKANFVAVFNAPLRDASPDDFAWPVYQQALAGFDFEGEKRGPGQPSIRETNPADANWGELVAWLNANQPKLALVREAAGKPLLGYRYSTTSGPAASSGDNQPLVSVLLSHVSNMSEAAHALAADARLARTRGDAPRFIENLAAITAMAGQLRGPILVESLVALRIRECALAELSTALSDNSFPLTDAQLHALATLLAEPTHADGLISYSGERLFFADFLQRMYTDDGDGDGRLTLEGMRFWQTIRAMSPRTEGQAVTRGLLLPILGASRKQILAEYNRLLDIAESNLKKPFREAAWDNYVAEITDFRDSVRYYPLGSMIPSLGRSHEAAEKYLRHRDALLAAIALRRYQLRHGKLPDSLNSLVPEFLPAPPTDRLNDTPFQYRITDGSPVLEIMESSRSSPQELFPRPTTRAIRP